jgi:hypothetical protein
MDSDQQECKDILTLQAQLIQDSNYRNVELVEENGESFLSIDYDTTDAFINTALKLKTYKQFANKEADDILSEAILAVLQEGLKHVDEE